jgi:hypothetical protein
MKLYNKLNYFVTYIRKDKTISKMIKGKDIFNILLKKPIHIQISK